MRLHRGLVLALLLLNGDAWAQGLGVGTGTPDLPVLRVGKAAVITPCALNMQYDWATATSPVGCYAVAAVIR
jgi:hypothetical protein